MLGRYQVEKELGKGAMGVVYLGRDPKINRVVAIKTMALSRSSTRTNWLRRQGRFFREAETAGRLNHPNIVTIFDAGEEHDLAYIAMEFLMGGISLPFTKPDRRCRCRRWRASSPRVAEVRWPMRTATTSCIATSNRPTSCTSRRPTRSR